MKYVFVICAVLLIVASVFTALMMPDAGSPVPVLYWVTDNNPARIEQVRRFHQWRTRNGYPPFDLRLDTANGDQSKKIIQGVSGVAGDIMDVGGYDLGYFHAIGLLDDVTADARRMGFDPGKSYPAVEAQIVVDGRQYLFPCNVWGSLYFVNKATFRKYHQPLPPRRWTFEEFEQMGKRFVAAANSNPQHPGVFYASFADYEQMRRSLGLSVFNETLTRCQLDDPRNVRVLKLIHKWTYEDHLIPSDADIQSFSTASGYGGSWVQLFNSGHYGMLSGGRHILIQLRKFDPPLELGISEPPHGGFPNMVVGTRAAGIYAGSKHKDLARYFLAFLASEEYNLNIVEDADALPPNPVYTKLAQYQRPAAYPNEWECHEAFADAVNTIAFPFVTSPFVLFTVASRIDDDMFYGVMSDIFTPAQAAAQAQVRINEEIDRMLAEQPALRPRYGQLLARQKQIDELRRQGRQVPLQWIENPFHRSYYQAMGWAEEPTAPAAEAKP